VIVAWHMHNRPAIDFLVIIQNNKPQKENDSFATNTNLQTPRNKNFLVTVFIGTRNVDKH